MSPKKYSFFLGTFYYLRSIFPSNFHFDYFWTTKFPRILIRLENIEFSYGDGFKLSPVSLRILESDFLTILGPNGSGKSTLLKLISGYLSPFAGNVLINKKNIIDYSKKELSKLISYVPQFTYTIFPFSVYEIVMMGRTPYMNFAGYESAEDRDIVMDALDNLGLADLAGKGINEISGGEAQRVYIARALVQNAKIMLLDEPSAHLDLRHQISIFELLSDLNNKYGLTIAVVSHDLNFPGRFAKKVLLMKNGMMINFGDKSEILTVENIKNVFGVETTVEEGNLAGSLNISLEF